MRTFLRIYALAALGLSALCWVGAFTIDSDLATPGLGIPAGAFVFMVAYTLPGVVEGSGPIRERIRDAWR